MVNKNYETVSLNYSLEEMSDYLSKMNYIIEEINIYDSHSVYHNDIEIVEGTMMIAYKNEHPYPNHKENSIRNTSIEHEVFLVFRDELRKAILNLY
jgi:hypothetical protein